MVVNSIGSTCNSLLEHIRDSGLKFSCQETPFLLYITVRKSFSKIKTRNLSFNPNDAPVQQHSDIDDLRHEDETPPASILNDLLEEKETLLRKLDTISLALNNVKILKQG